MTEEKPLGNIVWRLFKFFQGQILESDEQVGKRWSQP